jgi:hypothetical protein
MFPGNIGREPGTELKTEAGLVGILMAVKKLPDSQVHASAEHAASIGGKIGADRPKQVVSDGYSLIWLYEEGLIQSFKLNPVSEPEQAAILEFHLERLIEVFALYHIGLIGDVLDSGGGPEFPHPGDSLPGPEFKVKLPAAFSDSLTRYEAHFRIEIVVNGEVLGLNVIARVDPHHKSTG